ncbi:MAG: tyrosine-type recombinase/integrase [Clostridia bacterium]
MELYKFCSEFLDVYKKPFLKPSTYERYQTALKLVPPELQLETLTPIELQKIINNLFERKYSATSIRHVKIIISQAIKKARQLGYTVGCDFSLVDMPKSTYKEPVYAFNSEQQRTLLHYCQDSYYYNLFYALLLTGCRVGELIALSWADIDLKRGYFWIRHTDYHGELLTPKTAESVRKLPISEALQRVFISQYRFGAVAGRVFKNTLDMPVKYRTLLDAWHRVLDRANLPLVGLHTLRHTYATNALRAGVDVKVLSKLLGHASVAVTLDIYCDVADEDKTAANTKITSYLEGLYGVLG